jgi:hypothetical protein
MKRIFVVALMVVACACRSLIGQVSSGSHTPRPVLDGSARLIGHYNPAQKLRLVVGLWPPHLQEEQQFLQDLQTKGSPEFHHFLKPDEWNSRFAPSSEDEQAVVDWAESQGLTVTHRYPHRLIVDVEAPAGILEKTLKLTINRYQFGATTFFSNDRDPEIPTSLTGIVRSFIGLNSLERMHPFSGGESERVSPDYVPGPVVARGAKMHADADPSKRLGALQPSSLSPIADIAHSGAPASLTNGNYNPTAIYSSEAYDFDALQKLGHCCNPLGNPGSSPPDASIAIATYGSVDLNDISGFGQQYPYLAYNIQLINIDGSPSCCTNMEGTADTEWATTTANSFGSWEDTAKVWVYQGVNGNSSTFTDIYAQMLADGVARVASTSYGCAEFYCPAGGGTVDAGQTMDTLDGIFSAMVGQGWTLVAASGDNGATTGCRDSDDVDFPASDPNVVAAGGTLLTLNSDGSFNDEIAWQGSFKSGACANNQGGSGGGTSAHWFAPSYQGSLSGDYRVLPDLALNAAHAQNIYFGGSLQGFGGTSIVAPELAGFFAQENAYLLYVGSLVGDTCAGSSANSGYCSPVGNPNWFLYYEGFNPSYAPHYPFYDIKFGCNSNDITAEFRLSYDCAGPGYDKVTGWGSANMLQLAWAINTAIAGDFGAPHVSFSGPPTHRWYNTNQKVTWNIADTSGNGSPANGVAGFSQAWDYDPGDIRREPTPGSSQPNESPNAFYDGPQFPNATAGWLDLNHLPAQEGMQGCHTVNVRAWDNSGFSSDYTYGPICFDTIPPVSAATLNGTLNCGGGIYALCTYVSPVTIFLAATDNASGVASTAYQINGGPLTTYIPCIGAQIASREALISHPTCGIFVATPGSNTVAFFSTDKAGNVERTKSVSFTITVPTTTSLKSSRNPSVKGQAVTLTATVTPAFGGAPTGVVTFKDGATILAVGKVYSSTDQLPFTTSNLAVGTHSITAIFGGDSGHFSSVSSVIKQVVEK